MITEENIRDIDRDNVADFMRQAFNDGFAYYAGLYIADALEYSDDVETDISLDDINELGENLAEMFLDNDSFCLNEADDVIHDFLEKARQAH